MSRVGKQPIEYTENVTLSLDSGKLTVKGPLGELSVEIPEILDVKIDSENRTVVLTRKNEEKFSKSIHGTIRSLINNAIIGVRDGYTRTLEVVGVGYRVKQEGEGISMNLGWNHPVVVNPPAGVKFNVPDENTIIVTCIDKQFIGEITSKIRSIRKPEPYKGKGIKYAEETVRRKERKSVAKTK